MNKIPPLDLTQQFATISAEVNATVAEILASGRYIGGPVVANFEQQFAEYIGVSHSVACNSGTDALLLALRALHIGPGDEVITTPFTFIASAEVISLVGATPVFIDIDPVSFNLDLDKLEAAITPQTKAIIPVHLFGQPVNMAKLMSIALNHQIPVIEDCAQAVGASWDGQKVGSIGLIGCFSFYPTKNLGAAGDGGAVTTNDPTLAANIRMLKEHGSRALANYQHEEVGINSRLDAIQAAILSIKLRYLDTWNSQRATVAHNYHQLLGAIPSITIPQDILGGHSVWNQYTIRVKSQGITSETLARDLLRSELQAQGISSMVYYPLPLHYQPVYKNLGYQTGHFPQAEQACQEVLSLPMFPEISLDQQQQVAHGLKNALEKMGL